MRLPRAVLLTLALAATSAAPAAADRLDEVKARGKLIVGVSDTTPAFTFKKDNVHVGYDIDLVKAVARRLGVAAMARTFKIQQD